MRRDLSVRVPPTTTPRSFFFLPGAEVDGAGKPGHETPHVFCFQADTRIASPVTEIARLLCWFISCLILKLQSGKT